MPGDKKKPGKLIKDWKLAETTGKDRVYVTVTIEKKFADLLEYWAPVMVAQKLINNNSAFAAGRYIMEKGIESLDIAMRAKFGGGKQ